jgi:formylglycine-generating enzyme required for sulfatase activity
VSRGGCWRGYPGYCRSANRYDYVSPAGRNSASLVKVINPQHGRTGFRFLLAPGQP